MIEEDLGLVIEQPLSIREQVYKRISDLIVSGRLAPAERIAENKLAQQLGVSRTPVREALHILEMEGFLESIPRVGYKVKEIRWEEVEELCEIRKVNEILAARWALVRITPEELSSLEKNLGAAQADAKKGATKSFIDHDADFHDVLIQASGSQRLMEICQILRRHMRRYRIESLTTPESVTRAIESHRHILDQLIKRDAAGIEEAISDHLDFVKRDIRQYTLNKKEPLSD
jgi:DNA-binding GntR family transcriptional regulator